MDSSNRFSRSNAWLVFLVRIEISTPVSRDVLRDIATQFHNWTVNRSKKWDAPILDAPEGRRDEFVQPYFKAAKPDPDKCLTHC
jgi:hypothetical protein